MPTYQYACTACGHAFEVFQSFSDDALTQFTHSLQAIDTATPDWRAALDAATEYNLHQALAREADRPVVIADTQDNPGAGGDSNTTGMLRALIEADAQDAALGLLWDPDAVQAAVRAGVGQRLTVPLTVQGQLSTPEQFAAFQASESARWKQLIETRTITAD
mgnify:CR=1 FL=1